MDMTAHTDPLKLENLISWLETKPAAAIYEFQSNNNCLLAQFLKACGCCDVWVGGYTLDYDDHKDIRIPKNYDYIAGPGDADRTFRAATLRAREAFALGDSL
jgi:hypothetical protein